MSKIFSAVRTFVADEEGVTALEYGMIAALIAAVILASVETLGLGVEKTFDNIAAKMPK